VIALGLYGFVATSQPAAGFGLLPADAPVHAPSGGREGLVPSGILTSAVYAPLGEQLQRDAAERMAGARDW